MDDEDIKRLLPKIDPDRHKYESGFVAAIAGSLGMYGAAKLAALAALRCGCGIVKVISEKEIPNAFYEMVNPVISFDNTEEILKICNKANSLFIGPGIGRNEKIAKLFSEILPKLNKKLIIDADGLYHLSNNLYTLLPHETVLTPHRYEMLRLLHKEKLTDSELHKQSKKFSEDKNVIIVLKGSKTVIFHPKKKPLTITGGDPGMATAGSGDVLTGMIASFAAQKLDLYVACELAVKMHFMAGKEAAEKNTSYCMIASDIIESLPRIFRRLNTQKG